MKNMKDLTLLHVLLFLISVNLSQATVLNGFDDSILFKLNWLGKAGYDLIDPLNSGDSMIVTTHNQEKYKCILPKLKEKEEDSVEEYNGPTALELLAPLFQISTCSSRLESYWTYELCHGKYVKQYHEEREGKKVSLQQYYLGRWEKSTTPGEDADVVQQDSLFSPPIKKLDGMNLPYLQLNFTGGTICDLNGKPRETHVLYVCYTHGKNEIYSIKETSTCVYEVIVLTALLCQHPKYRPQETGEHDINCLPLEGSPKKPLSLLQMEAESLKQRHFKAFGDSKNEKLFTVYSIGAFKDEHGRKQVRVELLPLDGDEAEFEIEPSVGSDRAQAGGTGDSDPAEALEAPSPSTPPVPSLPIQEFLSGKDCLQGGSGWWKFKFCYGQSVEQYHLEKGPDGNIHKSEISLGIFNRDAHIEWIKKNPHKRPKPLVVRRQFSHFYGGGSFCEKTGKARETEVKFKCVEKKGTVSLYLLEPHVCQYELGIESPLVCELLDKIDENGLVIDPEKEENAIP